MCYGDPYHGSDGYYLEEIEYWENARREKDEAEQAEYDKYMNSIAPTPEREEQQNDN